MIFSLSLLFSSLFTALTPLKVLDDGRLTDGAGRVVDFTNTVIILTSNLGAEHLLKELASGRASTTISPQTRELVMQAVRRHFRPEVRPCVSLFLFPFVINFYSLADRTSSS